MDTLDCMYMIVQIDPAIIKYSDKTQEWCRLPYKGRPKGCPNYGAETRELKGFRPDIKDRVIRECPPTDLTIPDIFDISRPLFVIYNKFELGKDAERRRQNCPHLPHKGQWYNILYWQGKARKQLYAAVTEFLDKYEGAIVDLCPEAHGLIITPLMKELGIKMRWEWPPQEHSIDNIVYQIAVGGYLKK